MKKRLLEMSNHIDELKKINFWLEMNGDAVNIGGWVMLPLFKSDEYDVFLVRSQTLAPHAEHFHEYSEELFLVTKGEVHVQMNGGNFYYKKGECGRIPPKVPHSAGAVCTGTEAIICIAPPEEQYHSNGQNED